jgi:uncharacterized cupin superfamily protein
MAAHPNVIHTDDVEQVVRDRGDLRFTRRRLGAAGGTVRVGLSLWDIPPSSRAIPVHVHADEEEIFYVLSGSGLSWQDGHTYEIAAGDCIVHRIQGEAHTVIAGDGGMSVLAFGEGSDTNLTWLPRAEAMWAASHWLPIGSPNPFKAEEAAGPLELPASPDEERPPSIVSLEDCPAEAMDEPAGYTGVECNLAAAAGSVRSGLRHVILHPNQASCPPHWHTVEEEIFYVLGGTGVALIGEDRAELRAGSVVIRPPGTRDAHALLAGDDGLTYLAYGTRDPADICFYPRSNKVNILGVKFQFTPVDYWVGEESPPV